MPLATRPPGSPKPVTKTESAGYIRFFNHYGLSLREENQQMRGDCPFFDCEKPTNHFYMNPATGQWDCKFCGRNGNCFSFLQTLWEVCWTYTPEEMYDTLSEERPGIPAAAFAEWQLAYNYKLDEWMIPSFNHDGEVKNIYVWRDWLDEKKNEWVKLMMSSPSPVKQMVYGLHKLRTEKTRPLIICEGHWDTIAVHWFMSTHTHPKSGNLLIDEYDVIGTPGTTFPREYLPMLDGRDIRILYDNDAAGRNGAAKMLADMASNGSLPHKASVLVWPDGTEAGYDMRDLIYAYDGHPNEVMKFTLSNLQTRKVELGVTDNEGYIPDLDPTDCGTFDELMETWRSGMDTVNAEIDPDHETEKVWMTPGIEASAAIGLAINVSLKLGGPALWGHLVGPASSGKTTAAEMMGAAHPYCYSVSKITGVFSGFRGKGDPSMLPKWQDKMVIIKDLTTLLNGSQADLDRIMGELRDVYDGHTNVDYRNMKGIQQDNIRFTMLTCVTDVIRQYNASYMGERFLQFEIDSTWDERGVMSRCESGGRDHIRRALRNVTTQLEFPAESTSKYRVQKAKTWGFLQTLYRRVEEEPERLSEMARNIDQDEQLQDWIGDLSQWVAFSRATVQRDRERQIAYRPRVELGLRLGQQLIKLVASLCVVFDEVTVTERIKSVVRKVALDTGSSFQQEIMFALAHSPNGMGMSRENLCQYLGLASTTIQNRLTDMRELGIVTSMTTRPIGDAVSKPLKDKGGRGTNIYKLTDNLTRLAKSLGFM